jgi:hypothetical protein
MFPAKLTPSPEFHSFHVEEHLKALFGEGEDYFTM